MYIGNCEIVIFYNYLNWYMNREGKFMTNIWHDISPKRISPEDFVACIEIPRAERTSTKWIKETGMLCLDQSSATLPLIIRQITALFRAHMPITIR